MPVHVQIVASSLILMPSHARCWFPQVSVTSGALKLASRQTRSPVKQLRSMEVSEEKVASLHPSDPVHLDTRGPVDVKSVERQPWWPQVMSKAPPVLATPSAHAFRFLQ